MTYAELAKIMEAALRSKQFTQGGDYFHRRMIRDLAEAFHDTSLVNRPNLIQGYVASFSLENDCDTGWPGALDCGHRRDDEGVQRSVHLIRRNYQAGSGLARFCPSHRIKPDKTY
jgi:hypothetical protein